MNDALQSALLLSEQKYLIRVLALQLWRREKIRRKNNEVQKEKD